MSSCTQGACCQSLLALAAATTLRAGLCSCRHAAVVSVEHCPVGAAQRQRLFHVLCRTHRLHGSRSWVLARQDCMLLCHTHSTLHRCSSAEVSSVLIYFFVACALPFFPLPACIELWQ